jgi:1,4-dihydroxy-2-naphthoate octaprenyltransferase
VLPAAVPPGLLITAIMVVNNLRDIETDRKAGKKTLAVILGHGRTVTGYKLLLLFSYLVPPLMLLTDGTGIYILLPLFTLPQALALIRRIKSEKGALLNELLAGTAKLSLFYSLLFSVGLAIGTSL